MSFLSTAAERVLSARFALPLGNTGMTVLIAHPEPVVRDTLSVALGMCAPRTGRVLEAGTLSETLAQLRTHAVDLVFCSLVLPDAPGADVVRRLAPELANADLALMSGGSEAVEAAVEEALRLRLRLRGIVADPVSRNEVKRVLEHGPSGRARASAMPVQGLSPRELEDALEERQIEVHYQPTVSIAGRRLLSVEALARWNHPQRGRLDASHFILLAERSGLMPGLTLYMARQALRQIAEWRGAGLQASLSLNVSTAGIDDMDLPELLLRAAEAVGVSPQWVVIEVSERQLANVAGIFGTLAKLHRYGFRLCVDHFGTSEGTEIGLLRRLNFTELKIDRSIVTGAASSGRRATLADSVQLGRRLDMRVIAAGVESEEDWRNLSNLGCNAAQGFWISPPVASGGMLEWKARWQEPKPEESETIVAH